MNTTNNLSFDLPEGTKSLNLYKLYPPFRKLVDGYGYPGVILERTSDGKIQCHECGDWFETLGNHTLTAHKLTAQEYKKKYSLRKKDVLISRSMKTKQSKNHKRHNRLTLKSLCKRKRIKAARKSYENNLTAKYTLAALNDKGLCPDQINHRFDVVACLLKKQPSLKDIYQYDSPIASKIVRQFGSFNNYLKSREMPTHTFGTGRSSNTYSDIQIIVGIRQVFFDKGHVRQKDLIGFPSYPTILKRFGSLENALREAGINSKNWTMVG